MTESEQKHYDYLFHRVKTAMAWTDEKTALWFDTPNPFLGNMTPEQLFSIGKAEKLEKFIDSCVRGE